MMQINLEINVRKRREWGSVSRRGIESKYALEQSSRVARRKNFPEEKFGISYCFETTIDIIIY